jgi:hypothetical protein
MTPKLGCGTLAVVDGRRRVVVKLVEVFVSAGTAAATSVRPPDFEDSRIISWGSVTRDEAVRVISCEHDDSVSTSVLDELEPFFSSAEATVVPLFFRKSYDGE